MSWHKLLNVSNFGHSIKIIILCYGQRFRCSKAGFYWDFLLKIGMDCVIISENDTLFRDLTWSTTVHPTLHWIILVYVVNRGIGIKIFPWLYVRIRGISSPYTIPSPPIRSFTPLGMQKNETSDLDVLLKLFEIKRPLMSPWEIDSSEVLVTTNYVISRSRCSTNDALHSITSRLCSDCACFSNIRTS